MGIVEQLEIESIIEAIQKACPGLKCDDLLQELNKGINLRSSFGYVNKDNFISFMKDNNVSFSKIDNKVDLSSVSALNLCLFLQHHIGSSVTCSMVLLGIMQAFYGIVKDMIDQCKALEKDTNEAVTTLPEPEKEPDEANNAIKLMRFKKIEIMDDELMMGTYLITADAFVKLQESYQMITRYLHWEKGPVTENIFVKKDFFEKLPDNYIYSELYIKKDDSFILSEKMLFSKKRVTEVISASIIVGLDASEFIYKSVMMLTEDYNRINTV